MNPCPCGFANDVARECRCTPQQVARYRGRLSGPLRDRLDLTVEVPAVPPDILGTGSPGESSVAVRGRVVAARERQRTRYESHGFATNAALTTNLMARYCGLERVGLGILSAAVHRLGLTARGYERIRKVARTVADLDGADEIRPDHLAEALQFRMPI
jgi:magnesium chelatase family protein